MHREDIPIFLTRSRLVLGPGVLIEALAHKPSLAIGVTLVVAVLGDIFDGVLARRWKIVTAELRVADSQADMVFWLSVITALLTTHYRQLTPYWPYLALVAGMELVSTAIDQQKYGRASSHHAYTSKIWALSLLALSVACLCFNRVQPYLWIFVALGIVNNIEGYIIRGLLPLWAHDISGIPAAIRIRKMQLNELREASEHTNLVS